MAFINDNEVWDSQVEDCYFVDNLDCDGSRSQSIESSQSEIVSYSCDGERTPVKGTIERANFAENINNKNKRKKQCEPWSQAKRRRELQFDSDVHVLDGLLCTDESNSSILTTSNEAGDSVNEVLSQMSYWLCEDANGADETSLPCKEVLDQSFEGWLSSCLIDAEMEFNTSSMDSSGPSVVRNNPNVGTQNLGHRLESTTVPEHPIIIRHNSNLTGKKSSMQTPDSSPASVVYPFTFLKPCSLSGDVTLKDINQKLNAPPKSLEDPSYSAFSGKPVVAKTKLCTGGGKGSITIMRTKG